MILAGPTAVGKSDVAATLCSRPVASDLSFGHRLASTEEDDEDEDDEDDEDAGEATTKDGGARGHVVSADSVQVYRGADVGSNKPTRSELDVTPHHLIDVVDLLSSSSSSSSSLATNSSYNAADWMDDARYVIRKLAPLDDDDCDYDEADDAVANGATARRREIIDEVLRRSLAVPPSSRNDGGDGDDDGEPPTSVLPVVVGGTMMYLQWLVRGMPDAVRPTDAASGRAARVVDSFRSNRGGEEDVAAASGGDSGGGSGVGGDGATATAEAVAGDEDDEEEEEEEGVSWEVAASHVSSLGPLFARRVAKLPGRDWYRLRRLLEVAYTISSTKMMEESKTDGGAGGSVASSSEEEREREILRNLTEAEVYTGLRSRSLSDLGYDVRCFFLCPDERMTHFHVVDERCERMLMSGLLREVAGMCGAPGGLTTSPESQVERAIGYRQALRYLRRADARRNDADALASFVDEFASATRQYAKKQMQWFRRDGEFAFVPMRMDGDKDGRVRDAAGMIADLCKLRREDFDAELRSGDGGAAGVRGGPPSEGQRGERPPSLSAQTKSDNERQGKTMKFFMSKRVHLIDGTDEFRRVMAEADECTRLVQGFIGEEF